jgi:hypothetical protein
MNTNPNPTLNGTAVPAANPPPSATPQSAVPTPPFPPSPPPLFSPSPDPSIPAPIPTRKGKIDSLPLRLREELNERLCGNESGAQLAAWLNGLPAVMAVLQAPRFAGAPITEQNLSTWRQGGFVRWQRQQERLDFARTISEESAGLDSAAGPIPFADCLADHAVMALALQFRDAESLPAGPDKDRKVISAVRELTRLRSCNQQAERNRMAAEDRDAACEASHQKELRKLVKLDQKDAEAEDQVMYDEIWTRGSTIETNFHLLQIQGKPIPKKMEEEVAGFARAKCEIALRHEEANKAAWFRVIAHSQKDRSMLLAYEDMVANGEPVPEALEHFVQMPESVRLREFRRQYLQEHSLTPDSDDESEKDHPGQPVAPSNVSSNLSSKASAKEEAPATEEASATEGPPADQLYPRQTAKASPTSATQRESTGPKSTQNPPVTSRSRPTAVSAQSKIENRKSKTPSQSSPIARNRAQSASIQPKIIPHPLRQGRIKVGQSEPSPAKVRPPPAPAAP